MYNKVNELSATITPSGLSCFSRGDEFVFGHGTKVRECEPEELEARLEAINGDPEVHGRRSANLPNPTESDRVDSCTLNRLRDCELQIHQEVLRLVALVVFFGSWPCPPTVSPMLVRVGARSVVAGFLASLFLGCVPRKCCQR